jgi:hypothetical protein
MTKRKKISTLRILSDVFGLDLEDEILPVLEDVGFVDDDTPRYVDGDYICPVCGEPWDASEVRAALRGEKDAAMTKEEAERFLNGEGCPSCEFGKKKKREEDEDE